MMLCIACMTVGSSEGAIAQGVTTASIRGSVGAEGGANVDGTLVRVVNGATGYSHETRVRRGGFLVQGLAPGGPYRVFARNVGYSPQIVDGIFLALGERREIDLTLSSLPRQLDTLVVSARNDRAQLQAAGGVGSSISDSALRRLPTLNRDVFDFVRLVPQAGTHFGLSGGGASVRFNNYVIDGVSDRQLQGNNVIGGPTGGKTISLEAVKEYQVLLSPYDARYGGFSGMLVNAVTKSGTNQLRGTAYGYLRNEQLARSNSFVGSSPYRREQFGFSLGGPVMRDRIHFFIAPEFQHAEAPAPGPYVGQGGEDSPTMPVSVADVARFASLLRASGLDPGDGRRVTSLNPTVTLFGRIDISIPEWKSRVVLRDTYSSADMTRFSRPDANPVFPLTSNAWTIRTGKRSTSVQIFTHASSAAFNELVLSYMKRPLFARDYSRSPSIQAGVAVVNGVGAGALIAGPPPPAGGTGADEAAFEIADHLTLQLGSRHTFSAGAHVEVFRYHRLGVGGRFGQWRFASLDALANGDAFSYSLTKDFGSAEASLGGSRPSAYVMDDWRLGDHLKLTLGLRADAMNLTSRPDYNAAVDSIFQRRTSDYPRFEVQLSPRVGVTWAPFADERLRIRGGMGIFVGPPPLGWILGPIRSNGMGVRTLTCSGSVGSGTVPKFVADPDRQPELCADGTGFSDGPVGLVDRNLRMAESFRTSIAIDARLPWGVTASTEALYSRVRSDFMLVNARLAGPQGVDANGRVMYGSIDGLGRSQPVFLDRGRFPEVFEIRNHSRGHSWAVTAQLEKPFSDRLEMRASYTHSRVRDLQSLTNGAAVNSFDTWAGGRPLSTRHDDMSTGVSAFGTPHRFVLAATYVAPWRHWTTDISLYYVGESGAPFTFNDSTAGGMGDLNADGTSANDPIYVPRDATDPLEIAFAGADAATQGAAFEDFIQGTPCLRRQRGQIAARNSCRGPWVHTSNASLRQSLQAIRGHDISLQLEVFNLLNLISSSSGLFKVPNATILQHVGQTSAPNGRPMFRFNAEDAGYSTRNLESGYQLQFSLRYTF